MELGTSVVIATRDRLPLLQRVVRAVRGDPATTEVVVVDDGSGDGTARWLRDCPREGPPLRTRRCAGVGAAAARQAGVEAAAGELVVLLDDDVLPRAGLVSGHRALLCDARTRVVVGYIPVRLPARRGPHDVAAFAYARDYERRCARWERGDAPVLHNLWGGNVGIWREAALHVGLAAPPFDRPGAFHEDQDFGLRACRAGLHGVFERTLAADHHHTRAPAAALADAERRGIGAVRVHRRHADLIGPYVPAPALPAFAGRAALPPALAAIELTGRLRRWRAQDAGFKLARRICEQRGAAAALREVER